MSRNNNPTGKNQYRKQLSADDPLLIQALTSLHKEKLTNNSTISERLEMQYGIVMKLIPVHDCAYNSLLRPSHRPRLVKKRRKQLGLLGCKVKEKELTQTEMETLVLDQVSKDCTLSNGVSRIWYGVAQSSGVHLRRKTVSDVMHEYYPEGFTQRDPTTRQIRRTPIVPKGIHETWSADGHDKLNRIGLSIWAIVDQASSRWIGGWVMPSNRYGKAVAVCLLKLIIAYEGIPKRLCTDCGSETTVIFGIMNTLRERFHPEIDAEEYPPHQYLRSVHNVSIERSWRHLRLDFGDNAISIFQKGIDDGVYNPLDINQKDLCRWVWSKAITYEMDTFMIRQNAMRMRKLKGKAGPSGQSRNEAFFLHEKWGGENCLLPIDVQAAQELMDNLGGEEILRFLPAEYEAVAEAAFNTINITAPISMQNAWLVFTEMYPLMRND